jgi:hypothetical protein
MGRLLTVGPDMDEFLALVTLRETSLSFIRLAIWQRLVSLNISWDFDVIGKVTMKGERFHVDVPL